MGLLSDGVNVFGLSGAVLILLITITIAYICVRKMRTDIATGELGSHEWDGIREFVNDIPKGWLLAIIGTVIWAIWYVLLGYPLDKYSQIGEYNEDMRSSSARFQKEHENITPDQLQVMGGQLFLLQCSQCHGITADGMGGKAQNLTHWGKEQGIIDTIKNGSKGLKQASGEDHMAGEMPPELISDEEEMAAVAAFIMHDLVGDGKTRDPALIEKGREVYEANCAGCHGEDGKGMEGMAADLTQYGKAGMIHNVVMHGKSGHIGRMPSFNYMNLNSVHIRALEAFIANQYPLD